MDVSYPKSCPYADQLLTEARRLMDGQLESLRNLQQRCGQLLQVQIAVAGLYVAALTAFPRPNSALPVVAVALLLAGAVAVLLALWPRPFAGGFTSRSLTEHRFRSAEDFQAWLAASYDGLLDELGAVLTATARLYTLAVGLSVAGLATAAAGLLL